MRTSDDSYTTPMPEVKDPAIKLFGKTIQLLYPDDVVCKSNEQQHLKKPLDEEEQESIDPSTSSAMNDDPKTPNDDKETSSKNNPKNESQNSEEKPQKPDKILPCPRCNSMDTKFCYYNNYNVNQPRHFCKNCQRYWTAGGTMRNTPVGSGRRKNKSSSSTSHYRHINGSILTFGSDVPLCESMDSALNLEDNSKNLKNEEDHLTFCSSSASNIKVKDGLKNFQGYPLQVPIFPAPPWPYPWSSASYRLPMAAPANLGHSGFPVSFYPTPQYWGCTVQPTPWTMPWVTPPIDQFAPTSPLGKHSRDGDLLSPSSRSRNEELSRDKDTENGVLIPKTLRINDPNEAAKSSLWSTLGILKDDHNKKSTIGGNLHKAFQSKSNEKNGVFDKSLVNLQVNPAALSRSLNFRETS